MQYTSGLRERVEAMPSEELAGVLTIDPHRYRAEFLELARVELEIRGFAFRGRGGAITDRDGFKLIPRAPARPPAPYRGPEGIGGWLLVYILSHLICRPLLALGDGVGPSAAAVAQMAETFPAMAVIVNVSKMLTFGLIFFGVAVSLTLLCKGESFPVRLAKIHLAAYPLVCMFLAALYGFSDFPEESREQVVQGAMMRAVWASAWSLAWLLYFNRSKRVQATYYADEYAPGDDPAGGAALTSPGPRP